MNRGTITGADTNCADNEACLSWRARCSRQPHYVGQTPDSAAVNGREEIATKKSIPIKRRQRFTLRRRLAFTPPPPTHSNVGLHI